MNLDTQILELETGIAKNWKSIIEICDIHISAGNEVSYFRSVKRKALKEWKSIDPGEGAESAEEME